jgi:Aldo/keto reductase family
MEYATLGYTGLLVSKLCFGTMTFGDGRGVLKAIGAVGQAEADELVKTSIDGGINFFDTADNYTEGEGEKILGQSLKNLNIARKDVVIATKVYSGAGPTRNDVGASRGHIIDAVEASLRRLQTDHIDLYQIHGNDSVAPVEETLRALDTLVRQGKSATSAAPTGRHGRSPKRWASQSSVTLLDSTRFKLFTRSPGAISNGKLFLCSNPKRSAYSCGVRLPAPCFPSSSAGNRTQRIRAVLNTTFPSWIKSGSGRSST